MFHDNSWILIGTEKLLILLKMRNGLFDIFIDSPVHTYGKVNTYIDKVGVDVVP